MIIKSVRKSWYEDMKIWGSLHSNVIKYCIVFLEKKFLNYSYIHVLLCWTLNPSLDPSIGAGSQFVQYTLYSVLGCLQCNLRNCSNEFLSRRFLNISLYIYMCLKFESFLGPSVGLGIMVGTIWIFHYHRMLA